MENSTSFAVEHLCSDPEAMGFLQGQEADPLDAAETLVVPVVLDDDADLEPICPNALCS